jgi:hypothetical protein
MLEKAAEAFIVRLNIKAAFSRRSVQSRNTTIASQHACADEHLNYSFDSTVPVESVLAVE